MKQILQQFTLRASLLVMLLVGAVGSMWGETVTKTESFSMASKNPIDGWSCTNQTTYCGLYYSGGKSKGCVVANKAINNFSQVDFSTVSNATVTITVKGVTNSGTNKYTVSLIDKDGNIVGSSQSVSDKLGVGSNANSAKESSVTLTPVSGVTGYQIEFLAKGACHSTSYTLTYETSGSTTETCATPTFSLEEGYYKGTQNVTISSTTNGATIYYTTNGTEPTTSSTQGNTATISETCTLKAIAVKDGYNASDIESATYAIVANAGTEAEPFNVDDARNILTAFPSQSFNDVCVSGIISQIDSYSSQYKSITYWISDDGTTTNQFEVYSGKGLQGADFSAKEDLTVGNTVVVKGTIKKFNSTFEFDKNSEIVSMEVVSEPVINVDEALTLEYDATSGSIEYSITNPVSGVNLTATTTADWISNITVGTDIVTFTTTANDGNADRTATVTFAYNGAESKTVTVTQKFFVADYATLPFEFNGGKADIEKTAGLSQSGLGSDYSSSPKLRFDGTGDELVLKFNERPGTLTFDIKGNGFNGGTFKVQTSTDGTTYTDLETYTALSETNESFNNISADVRYIKWVYTEKVSGNVALGNIKLAQYSETPVETPTVNVGTLTNVTINKMWIGDDNLTDIEDGAEVEAGTVVFVEFTVAEGYTFESFTVVDADNNSVEVTKNSGNWSFVMPESSVTLSASAVESGEEPSGDKYELFSGDLVEGDYIIYYNGKAMNTTVTSDRLQYAEVTPSGNVITTDNAAIVWHIAPSGDYWTIYNAAANAYAASTGVKNKAQMLEDGTNDQALWTVSGSETYDFVNKQNTTNGVNAYLRNNGTYGFACYATGTGGALSLYKKVEAEQPITVTVGDALYTTFVAPADVSFPEGVTAYIVTAINEGSVHMDEVSAVPTNTPIVVKATAADTYTLTKAESAQAVTGNLLLASDGNVTGNGTIYALGSKNDVVGFYPVKSGAKVPKGKAYLVVNNENIKEFFSFDFGGLVTEINNVNTDLDANAEIYNLAGQRVQKVQKGFYIVGGKKVMVK